MTSNTEGNSQCHPITELSNECTDRPYEELLTLFVGKTCVPYGLATFMQAPPESGLLEGQFIWFWSVMQCVPVLRFQSAGHIKASGMFGLTGNILFEHVRLHPCGLLLCSWTDLSRGISQISCTSSSRTGLPRSSQSHPANLLFYYLE